MTTITREWLIHQISSIEAVGITDSNTLEAFKLALASLTAEPTVTFYRDGIEAAAAWVDQQRQSYDSEHGRHDPDTGSFEFGNDAQRDYSATLEEIAEGIRALQPNTAPPAQVSVLDDENGQPAGFAKWANRNFATNPVGTMTLSYCEDAWRAAMLHGSQPVSNRDELPPGIKPAPELDSMIKNAGFPPGNSPVIPDCSCRTCRPVTMTDMRFVVCPECGNKRCPRANDHMNACTGSNEPGQEGSAYPAAPLQEVK